MITINTISNTRFAFNGIQYLKNYISRIAGDRIEIYNCYERQDVLLPLTLYSEIQLDGIVYNSAAELQQEILGVIYLRNTLDDAGISTQNNAGRYLPFGEIEGEGDITPIQVATWINSQLFAFLVSDTATPVWLEFTRSGKKYIFNFIRGKGLWGFANGTGMGNNLPVNSGDFKLISVTQLTGDDVNNATGSTIITLGEIEDGDYLTAANSQERDFSDAGTFDENGNYISYYFSYTQDEVLYFVQFIGEPGIYGGSGVDNNDFTTTDFVGSTNSEIQPTPGLQEVTNAGPNTTNPITIVGANSKLTYTSEGSSIISSVGRIVNVKYDEPIAPEVNYSIPAKEEDDTFAMISDVEQSAQNLQDVLDNGSEALVSLPFNIQSQNNEEVKGSIKLLSDGVNISGEAGGVTINGGLGGVDIRGGVSGINLDGVTGIKSQEGVTTNINGVFNYQDQRHSEYTDRSLVDKAYADKLLNYNVKPVSFLYRKYTENALSYKYVLREGDYLKVVYVYGDKAISYWLTKTEGPNYLWIDLIFLSGITSEGFADETTIETLGGDVQEFAVRYRPQGGSGSFNWFPFHGNGSSIFTTLLNTNIWVDGVHYDSYLDLPIDEPYIFKKIKINQTIGGKYTEVDTENQMEVDINTIFDNKQMSLSNDYRVLSNIEVNRFYGSRLNLSGGAKAIFSDGVEIENNLSNSITNLGSKSTSVVIEKESVFAVNELDALSNNISEGQSFFDKDNTISVWNRTNGTQTIYWNLTPFLDNGLFTPLSVDTELSSGNNVMYIPKDYGENTATVDIPLSEGLRLDLYGYINNHPDTNQEVFNIWTGTHQEFEDYVSANGAFPPTTQVFLEVEPVNELLFRDQGDGLIKSLSIVNGVVTVTEVL